MANEKTVYLSGPITNMPQNNYKEFAFAQAKIQSLGYTVINPHDLFNGVDTKDFTHDDYMRCCIVAMMNADIIVTLHGWEDSIGAVMEVSIARTMKSFTVIHIVSFLNNTIHAGN